MSFLVDDYVYYLYRIVQNGGENHRKLCVELFKNRFFITRSAPKRDIDREKDGLELRKEWSYETHKLDNIIQDEYPCAYVDYEMRPIPCTMLEMIIGISKRMSEQLMDEDGEDKTAQYFWEIMENLGLTCMDDDNFGWETGLAQKKIAKTCEILCKRQYNPDGTGGGMFPMPGVFGINQKKMEIWYQMQDYINWKYRIKWV